MVVEEASITQLRRGVLEFCVLAILEMESTYGFDLVSKLSAFEGMVTSEGTIYPLLSRLRKGGLVSTSWRESDAGPPRKYYTVTPSGIGALRSFETDWDRFKRSIDTILAGRGEGRSSQ